VAPPNCLIRRAVERDLPAIAAIHVASWQDAYKGVVPEVVLLGRSIADCLAGWRAIFARYPANITVAALNDGRIHGFCCAGAVTDAGRNVPFEFEVYGLHVAPSSRRNGIGARLLHQALARARQHEGSSSAIVWTLADLTLSRKFYEREGGRLVKSGVFMIEGTALPEVAYGWMNLDRFAAGA
jgi:GNAT superfamily N-acetyltransferase